MTKKQYRKELADPRWNIRSSERKIVANGACERCRSGKRINTHHIIYIDGRHAWEYEDDELEVLCRKCHRAEHGIEYKPRQPRKKKAEVIAQNNNGYHAALDWYQNALASSTNVSAGYRALWRDDIIAWMLLYKNEKLENEVLQERLCHCLSFLIWAGIHYTDWNPSKPHEIYDQNSLIRFLRLGKILYNSRAHFQESGDDEWKRLKLGDATLRYIRGEPHPWPELHRPRHTAASLLRALYCQPTK
jgi:hypothetical protein